ncbi:MAG: Tol-Pal system beta propeller repeat protein TolB [Nitrospinota bacterium]
MSKFEQSFKISLVVVLISMFCFENIYGATVHDVKSSRRESNLVEIAVPMFEAYSSANDRLGEEIAEVIGSDLKFTGQFAPTQNMDFLREAYEKDNATGKINFDEWRTLARHFLVKGDLEVIQGEKFVVNMYLYNVNTQRRLLQRKYEGVLSQSRLVAHMLSDDILKHIANDVGVATTRIAYVSRNGRHKELYLMDYDGGNSSRLTNDNSLVLFPHFHQKNNEILFTSYRDRNPDLYLLNLSTRTRKDISRRLGLNTTGEFTPNGREVVFSLSYRGNSEIYIINKDGNNLRRLTRAISIETSPTLSPDGRYIAYTSDRSGSPQIYTMKRDGSSAKRLTYSGNYNASASWSPNNDYIAYSSGRGSKFNIALIDSKDIYVNRSREVRYLTNSQGSNESPSFSHNGRHLAFSSDRTGVTQIYIMNRNGKNQQQSSRERGGGFSPSWGSSILDLMK